MTDEYSASVRAWTDLIRRARLGSSAKAVAMMLANYADSDGTRIFPGLTRLAVECELSYKTVQAAMEKLRRVGLVERVRRAGRRGQADEYRLTIGPDLLEHLTVLSPSQVRLAMEGIRRPWGKGPRPTGGAEVNDGPQPIEGAEVDPLVKGTSAQPGVRGVETSAHLTAGPQPNQWAPTHHDRVTTATDHSGNDLCADVAVPSASAPKEDPLPSKCVHGLTARLRSDGQSSCTLCRRSARSTDALSNVIPIRRGA